MAEAEMGSVIGPMVTLMGAAVVTVPLFRRLGLGSVLGYFAAGSLVGPSGLGLFTDPGAILHIAELGVVMFLFVIGLELRPPKLWAMRAQIFGLGLAQAALATALLTLAATALFDLAPAAAFLAAAGFVLSSTAVIMSSLRERGEITTVEGRRSVSILLLEDLMIVPLLTVVTILSPVQQGGDGAWALIKALSGLALLLVVGRWLLDPFFALLARARTREVLTAGALLVVLCAALLMQSVGLSMAMGTFLAGVMLSNSSYRYQVESDVEPFKGLLMGLFFLTVGMSLDLATVAAEWSLLGAMLATFVLVKSAAVYAVARAFGSANRSALVRTAMFAQGGEFAFVLYTAALAEGVIDARQNAVFATVVILSMAGTPLLLLAADRLLRLGSVSLDGVDRAEDLHGRVLLVGFGRFGQIALQMLLARGVSVSVIEKDPRHIHIAAGFGLKVYYGDGTRLDVLRAAGAADAQAILVCADERGAISAITRLAVAEFPGTRVLARSYDRGHSIELIRAGVDFEIRETVESAFQIGAESLRRLGFDEIAVSETLDDVRSRDGRRLAEQVHGDFKSGGEHLHIAPVPAQTLPSAVEAQAGHGVTSARHRRSKSGMTS